MKFAEEVRRAILEKNRSLAFAIDITKANEQGKSLDKDGDVLSRKQWSPRFSFKDDSRFKAAYLDIFVEDAICHLTERAKQFYKYAWLCIWLASVVLVAGIGFVLWSSNTTPDNLDISHLIMRIFSSLAVAGLVLVAAKGLLSLIRAFLHEGTRLLERRHALRFGKLYFYLELGDHKDNIKITLQDIQNAFQWNKETTTAFQDMKPEIIADTIINQLARMPASIIEKGIDEYFAQKKNADKNA